MAYDAATLPPADHEPRLKPWQLFVDSLVQPRQAMRNLAEHPGWRRWVWPLALLSLLSIAGFLVQTPQRDRLMAAVTQNRVARIEGNMAEGVPQQAMPAGGSRTLSLIGTGAGLVMIPLGTFLGAAIAAAVLHFVGTVLGGQQSYGQVLTAASWAKAPLILREGLRLVAGAAGNFDTSPAGLSGLVAADPLAPGAKSSLLAPLLAQVEIWNLWYLALLVLVVVVVSRLSRGKAVAAVGILLALNILLGVGGTAIANAVSGIGGGAG